MTECKEYADLAIKTVDVISLALHPSIYKISVAECKDSIPLIVGGKIWFFFVIHTPYIIYDNFYFQERKPKEGSFLTW
jgi:hypothetical protein